MPPTKAAVVVGSGLSTFLVVTAIVAEVAASAIEFSVMIGAPVGLIVGALVAAVANARFGPDADPLVRGAFAGLASVSYAALGMFAVSYAVAATRSILTTWVVIAIAAGVALIVSVAVAIRSREMS